ncbi:MAG: peptidoglycan DD-metalloendopeptidase family protein [Candidatus Kuenenbacteria bacterium]
MAERIIHIILARISRLAKNMGKSFWSFVFNIIIVPIYRFFLFIKRYFNKFLSYNPLLSLEQNKYNARKNSWFHIVMAILAILVLAGNIKTQETYAEEFGKNSILAEILIDDNEEEVVAKSKPIKEWASAPKTENILEQLSAIEAKDMALKDGQMKTDQIALAQGGDAIIQPVITPFKNDGKPENSELSSSTKNEIQYYYVKQGDSLSVIAEKFGVSINTILWENNLSLNSYIRPGDKLAILPVSGISYGIKSGDTLSHIASEFGTTVDKIVSFNNIDSESVLKVRQKIIIPGGKLGYSALTPTRSLGSIKNIFSPSSGTASEKNFLWPSVSKRITQYYHWRHTAIDIGAKAGSPIYAAKAGRVEYAGWSTGYGYNIIINHGGGVKTLYAHSRKLYVKRGDQVQQGEVLGEVGSTGWSTGPHIHFEIIINGASVNPLSYL